MRTQTPSEFQVMIHRLHMGRGYPPPEKANAGPCFAASKIVRKARNSLSERNEE